MADPTPSGTSPSDSSINRSTSRLRRATQVIVVGSVMFTFISYWRTAAVVLCDLASTAYYIGGIVEQSIGPAAPWFILAVMCFSYCVRSVYIESCALFVRGGVYRVVKEAMGGFLAKLSVSALMFDYILTGPISGVSAGQYLIGLVLETMAYVRPELAPPKDLANDIKAYGSAAIAALITLYFFRQNLLGIHESSEKAFKIMIATTIMAAIMLTWCAATLYFQGPAYKDPNNPALGRNEVPPAPAFQRKMNYDSGRVEDPLGFITNSRLGDKLRAISPPETDPSVTVTPPRPGPYPWFSIVGFIGLALAFGHSILAMSGEETLAQVYREVESPKLPNFRKAAFVVFVYSLVLTGGISFLAVLLIPESVRMPNYSGNLIGGLAMNVWGPEWAKLLLNAFVVVVGFLILAGAVNTAIIGSNGVLNRVAEDGVLPDWLLRPHPRFGTTSRILVLILLMQLTTIIVSRGDVILLGEAYAFGVVWSFVFKALSMVVLRFTHPGHREYKVPLNIPLSGGREIPVGLILIFLTLFVAAILNLLTKETATTWGLGFTAAFLTVFVVSEQVNLRKHPGAHGHHEHLEQFNVKATEEATATDLGLSKPYTKLVAIRSPHNLFMLEKALAETDPDTTSVVVMTAKVVPDESIVSHSDLDRYDQQLMTAVVERAEKAGKKVKPLIVPTNNPLHAVLKLAQELNAQEIVMGASNKYAADVQLDQVALYWMNLQQGEQRPITVRLLSRDRDVYLDLAGGNRIPKISERQARSVAELRAAGVGVDRVLLVHDGSRAGSDLFRSVLTMLDPAVGLELAYVPGLDAAPTVLRTDHEKAANLGRELSIHMLPAEYGTELVQLAKERESDLLILPRPELRGNGQPDGQADYVLRHAHCPVFLATPPPIPEEAAAE
jgi:amino acid transporter/nucleotide-binding universal stress UspA family protein